MLRGMFPHAAGKIASNGPYNSVKDIYKIQGLTERDKQLFRQYEREFATNPPGRTFKERINGRVSTKAACRSERQWHTHFTYA